MSNFEVTKNEKNGVYVVRCNEGEFEGIEFRYGAVEFDEDDEGLLHFDYFVDLDENNLLANEDAKGRFHVMIGDYLMELIQNFIEDQQLVCKGGVDS